MAEVHLTKPAVGAPSIEALEDWVRREAADGEVTIHTRYRPKREAELIGGSLYWIIAHRLAARQTILGFTDAPDGRRTLIRLEARIVPVLPQPKRAHQGWRYLAGKDAPRDLGGGGADELPPELARELATVGLI